MSAYKNAAWESTRRSLVSGANLVRAWTVSGSGDVQLGLGPEILDLLGRGLVNAYYAHKFNRLQRLGPVFAVAALAVVLLVDWVVSSFIATGA